MDYKCKTSKISETARAGMSEGHLTKINVLAEDILNCSYSHWYPKFKEYTISEATIFKPLPESFIKYLKDDGIELPKSSKKDSVLFQDVIPTSDNEYSDWEDEDAEAVTQAVHLNDPTDKFKAFHQQLQETIKKYGSVAPKFNWSAPQDATWIMTSRNMRCFSTSDLFLLLKSSDYVNHDLYHAFNEVSSIGVELPKIEPELILRKWAEINPAMEFRCFVRDRQLIAISQRDLNYYTFLEELQDDLMEKIGVFYDDFLMAKFDSNSFVFDVYIPKPFNKVYLIDFNPFQHKTDPLLFTWNELATIKVEEDNIIFRLVTVHNSGRFVTKAHSQNHVPRDFLDASTDTQAMVEFLKKMKELEMNGDASDSENEEAL